MTGVRVEIGVGPTTVHVAGEQRRLGPAETVVVAALALFHPDEVGLAMFRELVWPVGPPVTARASLQNHLSRIRSRVPGLIDRSVEGYRLGPDVEVVVDVAGGDIAVGNAPTPDSVRLCPELPDVDAVGQRRAELLRERRSVDEAHLERRLVDDDPAHTIPRLREAVDRDEFDERAWCRLIAATAAAFGRDAAVSIAEEASRTLATCGLEPGRRLRDLERLVRDGERDLARLTTDRSRAAGPMEPSVSDIAALARRASEVLEHLADEHPVHVQVKGPSRSGRSALLDLIVADAGRAGASVRAVAGREFGGLPQPIPGTWQPRRRRLLVIDDLDRLVEASRTSLAALVSAAVTEATADGRPLLVVTSVADPQPLPGGLDGFTNVEVELPAPATEATPPSGPGDDVAQRARLDVSTGERSLLEVLAVSEIPVHLDDLSELVPDAATSVASLGRTGLVRDRQADGRWSLVDHDVRDEVLAELSEREVIELHRRLAVTAFAADEPTVRARRVARHALAAAEVDRHAAVDALERAAEEARSSFDHHAAAALFERVAVEAAPVDRTRTLDAAVAAGRSLLAAGDVAGLDRLEAVVDEALTLGLEAPAAAATHAFCRLGPASTAGEVDQRAAALVERVLPRLRDAADRALVGGAATMVHVFAGDAGHCRELFDRALEAAEATGRDDVLAEVLPFGYLSRAAPEDLELRDVLADRLFGVAERLDRPDSRWEAAHLRFSNQLQRGDPGFRASAAALSAAADGSREVVREWEMAYVRATVAHVDGRLDAAEEEITASLALSGAVGTNRAMAVYGSVLLACRLDEDRVQELAPSIEAIAADQPLVMAWQAPLALAAAVTGDAATSTAAFDRLVGGTDRLPRECNYTAALVMLGEAAARLGDPARIARAVELLAPWSGRWAWTGTCSFGPIDLTLARLAESRGDRDTARRLGTAALRSAATMRAPVVADRAARLVLRQT